MALLLTPEKIPECCICLKDSVNRVIQTSGAAWRKQALGEKVEQLCNKSVRENIEESNIGICRLCVNQLVSSHAFVDHLKHSCARNSKRLSRTPVELKDGSRKVVKKLKQRKRLFSPPRPNIHTHCDAVLLNSCSLESLDSDSELSPLSASQPNSSSCVLMQTLQIASPVVRSTPRATGKENVTPISAQTRLSSSLPVPLAPNKLETNQVKMILSALAQPEVSVDSLLLVFMVIPQIVHGMRNKLLEELQAHCTELASLSRPSCLRTHRSVEHLKAVDFIPTCHAEMKLR